jgi:hypothetical protein
MNSERKMELLVCAESPIHFANTYGQIYDAAEGAWIPFDLWPAQARTLKLMQTQPLTVILKARQLGLTWLCLAYALWQMLFRPQAEVLLFSCRDDEAVHLLDERLKGMYNRLPDWMKVREVTRSNSHEFGLSNGSNARAFPTSAGDSYTATLAIVDEADLIPDFNRLMRAVKPTIDTGGRMVLLSRVDKTTPESEFKRIYRAAKRDGSPWTGVFMPWFVRPARDDAWYEAQKADILSRTGALDDLLEQYPATDTEALAPRSQDKRISPMWIEACYEELQPHDDRDAPAIPGLEIYIPPRLYGGLPMLYVIGADPAEGNPASDDSALTVVDLDTGEECAVLSGKYEPSTFGAYIAAISSYYWDAPAMIERNNHGHAVIQWVAEHADHVQLLRGHDDKVGWMSSSLGKKLLYTECADHFRQNAQTQTKILHSFASYTQLASIDGNKLAAPQGMHDDRADAFALAHVGRAYAIVDDAPTMQFHVAGRGGKPQVRRGRL